MNTQEKDIVIFDGECNLCNGVVGWLLKFAPPSIFEFVAFQSPKGQNLLRLYNRDTKSLDTVILIDSQGYIHTQMGFCASCLLFQNGNESQHFWLSSQDFYVILCIKQPLDIVFAGLAPLLAVLSI